MSIVQVKNCFDVLRNTQKNVTAVNQVDLFDIGDYGLAVFTIEANSNQRPHYHTFGDIDIFMVVSGHGILSVANIEGGHIMAETMEEHQLKPGDCYMVKPYTLHSIENKEDTPIVVLNVAPRAHSAPMEGEVGYMIDIVFPN